MATISTHVLNSVDGSHGGGIAIRLVRQSDGATILSTRTDPGGRVSKTVDLNAADPGESYDLIVETKDYWAARGLTPGAIEEVVLRFKMPMPDGNYHMPIILGPNGYSVWTSR